MDASQDAICIEQWIRHRNAEAFHTLVTRYAEMVFATSRRVLGNSTDAEDVVQECFQALSSVKESPAAFLGPWLHRVATNLALNRLRKESRLRGREEQFALARQVSAEPTWNDIYGYVDEALASLPDELRGPVAAHFLEGRSQTNIAAALGVPRQTLTNRIHKGVDEIRKHLARRGIEISGATLGAMLLAHFSEATTLPAGLAATLGKVALFGAGTNAVSVSAPWILSSAAIKTAFASAVAVAMLGAAYLINSATSEQTARASAPEVRESAKPSVAPVAPSAQSTIIAAQTAPAFIAPAIPSKPLNFMQVVDAYVAHQKRIENITVRFEVTEDFSQNSPPDSDFAAANGTGVNYESGELSSDGKRLYLHTYRWGNQWWPNQFRQLDDALQRICAYDGTQFVQWDSGGRDYPSGGAFIGKDAPIGETLAQPPSNGRFYGFWGMHSAPHAFGLFTFEGRRIDELLREAHSKSVKVVREGGTDYQVVDAETVYGTFSVWFDPNYDYEIARLRMTQREGQFSRKGDKHSFPPGFVREAAYNVSEFAKVSGQWVTKAYTLQERDENARHSYLKERTLTCTRSAIALNPDFNSLGAFAFMRSVPEGAVCTYITFVGDTLEEDDYFVWEGGKLVQRPPQR